MSVRVDDVPISILLQHRSVIVTALLGNCGMFVPCDSAVIPRYDSFFLRSTSYDIPSEGMSSFAVEMNDVHIVTKDFTHKSLIMLDEIGE
jgi:DNA mismatch repair ATPase MutS